MGWPWLLGGAGFGQVMSAHTVCVSAGHTELDTGSPRCLLFQSQGSSHPLSGALDDLSHWNNSTGSKILRVWHLIPTEWSRLGGQPVGTEQLKEVAVECGSSRGLQEADGGGGVVGRGRLQGVL